MADVIIKNGAQQPDGSIIYKGERYEWQPKVYRQWYIVGCYQENYRRCDADDCDDDATIILSNDYYKLEIVLCDECLTCFEETIGEHIQMMVCGK